MRSYTKLFIGGDWVSPAGDTAIDVISPHSGELVGSVPEGTPADVDLAVAAARRAFDEGDWPHLDPSERIAVLERFSAIYKEHLREMADLITDEMGSPISFSRNGQAPGAWMILNAFIDVAKNFPWEEHRVGVMADDVKGRSPSSAGTACQTASTPAGTCVRRSLPAYRTKCVLRARKSSARSCRSFLTQMSTTPSASRTTQSKGWPARSGRPTDRPASGWPGGCAAASSA